MDGTHGTKKATAAGQPPNRNRVIKANRTTGAARWNTKMLRGLEAALRKDPEANLTTLLPPAYSDKLQSFKSPAPRSSKGPKASYLFPCDDIRSRIRSDEPCTIIHELSSDLRSLVGHRQNLSEAIIRLLNESEVLYQSPFAATCMVFRVSDGIAAKVTVEEYVTNEYRALAYLQQHVPDFPAPKLHGVVRIDGYGLLFSTFIPGLDLEKAWPQLDDAEKASISLQLNAQLSKLRSLPFPANTPLGGVQGQGCNDGRRDIRVSSEPIIDIKQFEDFIFAGSKTASPMYTQFLRGLMPTQSTRVVFTHGDIRPANIMVDKSEAGSWVVVALVDWDFSGFYPEYWECVKMTNNLTPSDRDDWYNFLPDSVSPRRYPTQWLIDRVWDRSLENS